MKTFLLEITYKTAKHQVNQGNYLVVREENFSSTIY